MSKAPLLVKTSAEFSRLAEALEWAEIHCCQGAPDGAQADQSLHPMLVISRQTPYVNRATNKTLGRRTYVAIGAQQLPHFVESFRSDDKRHLDEIVPSDAPCKFALDCDWSVDRHGLVDFADEPTLFAALEQSFDALIERVVKLYNDRYGTSVLPCISAAVRAGKWSKHAIFDGAVWRNNRHCLALARELIQDDIAACGGDKERSLLKRYIDDQIYEKNHSLRMYRSSKVDEPTRSFRVAGELATAPVDRIFLHRTMITLFQVKGVGDGNYYYITSLFAQRFAAMLGLNLLEHPNAAATESSRALLGSSTLTRTPSLASVASNVEWTRDFVRHFQFMGGYKSEPDLGAGRMRIRCLNHNCAIKGSPHSKENIFLQIDLIECMWRQCCFKFSCRKTPTDWRPLPDPLIAICETVYENWDGTKVSDQLGIYNNRMREL